MGRDAINVMMVALLLFDLMLLLALLRGSRLASDLRAVLLFLLRIIR